MKTLKLEEARCILGRLKKHLYTTRRKPLTGNFSIIPEERLASSLSSGDWT